MTAVAREQVNIVFNLDLDNPHIDDHDAGCLLVNFDCKSGMQCVRQGSDAMTWLSKGISEFYPDGPGEMHSN